MEILKLRLNCWRGSMLFLTLTTLFVSVSSLEDLPNSANSVIEGKCELADKNISFTALSLPYYQGFGHIKNESVRIYISLCKPLSGLPENVSLFCDTDAYSCLTTVDKSGVESELIRNAGSVSSGMELEGSHILVKLENGTRCTGDPERNVSTRINFFCSNGMDYEDNNLRYEGLLGECEHQVFWHTSLACQSDSEQRGSSSCVIKVPGYDAIIDVGVWGNPDGFYLARSVDDAGQKELFHLNLCQSLRHSPCPKNSILCQVDDTETKMIKNILNFTDRHSLTYIEEKEIISLHYPSESRSVVINIECDRDAFKPQITLEHNDTRRSVFRFLTVSACLVPPVQCVAQDSDGNIFDLSPLKSVTWEIVIANEKQTRYQIKVCGSLPVSPDNPCQLQAGICTYRFQDNTTHMEDAQNLGIMYKRPIVNEDGDIILEYSHGSLYADKKGNSCNMSSEIILRCSDRELGPRFEEATACKHTLSWSTPGACAQKKVVSHGCTVREPLFSNLFDLSNLYNETIDYHVQGSDEEYILNVCGPLLTTCKGNQTCLRTEQSLTYEEGSLEMEYTSPTCKSDSNSTLTARIVFLCNHGIEVGYPRLVLEDGCQLELEWKTNLACPPHELVQCSVPTMEGLIDLSPLSLPHQNYKVSADETGEIFLLNLCRSLVHTNQSRCAYRAAACLISADEAIDKNIGEIHDGLKINADGLPTITYTLGSLCQDTGSSLSHMQTTINFICDPERLSSEPEFLELSNCHYIFEWRTASACPVQTSSGNCSVTSPESGFTFDLSSLNRPEGWRWNETSHHFINHLDLNICGPLESSPCGNGTGVCDNRKLNLGIANSNLTFTDGQLLLVYRGGHCPNQPELEAETRINFICPPRRMFSSGNTERDGPKTLKVSKSGEVCHMFIDFYTDLACDHQVYCDVSYGDVILPLTKLRRHDLNYKMEDKEGNDFYLNVCGPLVATDVPMSACNPQGVCGWVNGRYVGMGKVLKSPQIVSNGHIELRYEDGDVCESTGGTWTSHLYFTCNKTIDENVPFGAPRLVSVENKTCDAVFHVSSILACNDTTRDIKVVEPDSCQLYHPGKAKYINLEPLHGSQPYKVYDPSSKDKQEYYEIQPCGSLVPSCKGSVCKVTDYQNLSMGTLNDVKYYPDTDELRVRYLMGDICNSKTNRRFSSKIYYKCDPSVEGPGHPVMEKDGVLDCLIILNWRSRDICDQDEIDTYTKASQDKSVEVNISDKDDEQAAQSTEVPVSGGISWGHMILVLLLVMVILGALFTYKNPPARERLHRSLQEMRARLPVYLGGRRRDDSTLLVSGIGFGGGSLADDDDYT